MNKKINWEVISVADRATFITAVSMKSAKEAEKAITDLAHHHSDEAALEVMSIMSPRALARIIREYDYSCPSITGMIASPEQVAKILSADPSLWINLKNGCMNEGVDEIVKDVQDILTGIFLNKPRKWIVDALEEILENKISVLYLAIPLIANTNLVRVLMKDSGETLESFNIVIEEGTISHVYDIIAEEMPLFALLLLKVFVEGGEWDYSSVISYLSQAQDMSKEKSVQIKKVTDSMFAPL